MNFHTFFTYLIPISFTPFMIMIIWPDHVHLEQWQFEKTGSYCGMGLIRNEENLRIPLSIVIGSCSS